MNRPDSFQQNGITTWKMDPLYSFVHFAVPIMGISTLRGAFQDVEGTFSIDRGDLSRSRLEVSVSTESVVTGHESRDERLRSEAILGATKHPEARFVSTQIRHGRPGGLRVVGDLTIRGIARPVTLLVDGPTPPVRDLHGHWRIGLSGRATMAPSDFGVSWNSSLEDGRPLVGDQVSVYIDAQFVLAELAQASAVVEATE